ncbi:HPr(Ser) kinase/phosphatase [Ureaplasma canigenitalium]|uniref:HPr(Ser) kinase/phosphatase n=1 Tax=Ureaplasma canigenitalium TaxID=42092 RepID=UPI0004E0BEF6|nr:HPr(Ser) kinase/phosphatase [Ureaplasma canigenitalium]
MELKNKLYVSQVINKFNLDVVANEEYIDREILSTGISRLGFELSGEILFTEIWSIVYFGSKESNYFDKFSVTIIQEKLNRIFKLNPPLIIYGKNFKHSDMLLKIGKKYKIPIVKVDFSYYELNFTINSYISQRLSPKSLFHGTLLNIFGLGVMLIGESGVGKSELAIELVKKGNIFVADDAIVINRIANNIYGTAEESTKGFIEVRGLGIINFPRAFGIERMIESTRIELIIELVKPVKEERIQFERFGKEILKKSFCGVELVHYTIPVIEGRSIADIIETAITDYKLKASGYNSADMFIEQIKRKVESDNDK